MWFDKWCDYGNLDRTIRARDIYMAGLDVKNKVSDCIASNSWIWPAWWVNKYPFLQQIDVPMINQKLVVFKCLTKSNVKVEFNVKNVWEAIRVEGNTVPWANLVWCSFCIPKHAFMLWLAFGKKLKTQDKMKPWDGLAKISNVCQLCQQVLETHEHIFFKCPFSKMVWSELRCLIGMGSIPESWDMICDFMIVNYKH